MWGVEIVTMPLLLSGCSYAVPGDFFLPSRTAEYTRQKCREMRDSDFFYSTFTRNVRKPLFCTEVIVELTQPINNWKKIEPDRNCIFLASVFRVLHDASNGSGFDASTCFGENARS